MTEMDILDGILAREGGYRAEVERPNGSVDPETVYGVTWPTYQRYCARLGRPIATREAFLALGRADCRMIYRLLFIDDPGFTPEHVPFEPLRVQLIDFGVNSGPERAIRWLQRVIGQEPTGTMNGKTVGWLQNMSIAHGSGRRELLAIVNDALVAARSYMIDQTVDQGSVRKVDEEGLESRALSFFLARS